MFSVQHWECYKYWDGTALQWTKYCPTAHNKKTKKQKRFNHENDKLRLVHTYDVSMSISASTSTRKITRREPGRRKHKHKKNYVWTCREDACTCACILIALLCRTCGQRKHKHERKGMFLSVDISSLIEEKHCACVCPCVILISLVWTSLCLCLCLRRTCFQPLVIVAQCSHSKNMRTFYTKVEQ